MLATRRNAVNSFHPNEDGRRNSSDSHPAQTDFLATCLSECDGLRSDISLRNFLSKRGKKNV